MRRSAALVAARLVAAPRFGAGNWRRCSICSGINLLGPSSTIRATSAIPAITRPSQPRLDYIPLEEHLAGSDVGIAMLRRMLRQEIRKVVAGGAPLVKSMRTRCPRRTRTVGPRYPPPA